MALGARGSFLAQAGPGFPWTGGVQLAQQQLRYAAGLAHAPSVHHRLIIQPSTPYCVFLNLIPSKVYLTCIACIYWASLQCVTWQGSRYAVLRMRTQATTGCSAAHHHTTVAPAPQQWCPAAARNNQIFFVISRRVARRRKKTAFQANRSEGEGGQVIEGVVEACEGEVER